MRKKYLSALLFGALLVTSAGTFTSCKDYDDDIKNLQEQLDKKASLEELNSKISQLETAIDEAKTAAQEAKDKAQQALDAAQSGEGGVSEEDLNSLKAELQEQIDKLASLEEVDSKIANLKTELEGQLDGLASEEALAALQAKVEALGNELNELIGNRLTNLVFAPTSYVDGIEVINFATLKYKPWTNLLADKTDGTTEITINDGTTEAEYYVSPSSVSLSKIESLEFIANTATNINNASRAGQAPISVASKKLEDGKLVLGLKKDATASFGGTDTDEFTVVALKAKTILTAEEEKNGVDPYVFSDWARLCETSVTPYIHYAEYNTDDTDPNTPEHFYNYTEICDGGATGVSTTDGDFIIKNLAYDQELDLLSLVKVCDKDNNEYDAESYGLEFIFDCVDYNLQDSPEELTNQREFAYIKDGHIIGSKAFGVDGNVQNKDAIGREPLIQVVLRDKNNDKVVDVRYFKIKWTTADSMVDLENLEVFTGDYNKDKCENSYINTVGTPVMNEKIYAHLNVSKEDFHALYELKTDVYASFEDAKEGNASSRLGSLKDIVASGSTTTHNIEWTLPIADYAVTQSEYEAGKATRTVYGVYVNKRDNNDIYIFNLTLELKVAQMALGSGYFQAYWNKENVTTADVNKSFQVNPSLTSDNIYGDTNFDDCQIVGDIKNGYFPYETSVLALVDNAATAKFIFDSERVVEVLGTEWNVSPDGTELFKGLQKAATIDPTGIVQLFENGTPGINGQPTAAARELTGKNVPVKLYSNYCASTTVLEEINDKFLVNFINPLEMELKKPEKDFEDLITGGSEVSIAGLATIREAFGLKRVVLGNGAVSGLKEWYIVDEVTWDVDNATTNLKVENGNLIISNDVYATPLSNFDGTKPGYPKLKLDVSPDGTKLVFQNASGTHLQQEFEVAIPVYVKTKWNPTLTASFKDVVMKVKPGVTE